MMKYIIYSAALVIYSFSMVSQSVFAAPSPNCAGLPGCGSGGNESVFGVIGNFIAVVIQYIAVIAVIALMYGGILYLLSSGEEEKTKKAKNVILWALMGVILSMSAFALINILNSFHI